MALGDEIQLKYSWKVKGLFRLNLKNIKVEKWTFCFQMQTKCSFFAFSSFLSLTIGLCTTFLAF